MTVGSNAPVGSVASAVRILDLLAESHSPLRLKDIAAPLGINTSTCLNILRTLAASGMVAHDASTKTYAPGLGLVALARSALSRNERVRIGEPLLRDVAQRYGVTAMLWQRTGRDKMILLSVATGEDTWRIQGQVGSRSPILQGSMGRLMINRAGFSPAEQRAEFDALKWDRPISFEQFIEQAEQATERGWASDEGYFNRSMISISAPVIDRAGNCDAVITAAMFAGQHDAKSRGTIANAIMRVALAMQTEPFGETPWA